ncbi:MAG: sensor histidine kinase [Kiritimatiellaeota bacterium]|nr:sensor histidine kinase [Kiritimatiellota bacterium]
MNKQRTYRPWGRSWWLAGLLGLALHAQGAVLWRDPGPRLAHDNGAGVDLLHGAVKPQDNTSSSTLYFKFTVDPLSDVTVDPYTPYLAGLVLYERDLEHLGVGNGLVAHAYSAFNASGRGLLWGQSSATGEGEYDLNSLVAGSAQGPLDRPRRGILRTILFRVQYVPGGDDAVTVWFEPNLSPGNTEFSQPPSRTTRFKANASFDELHLCHRGGGEGWMFSDLAIATTFDDFVAPHLWQRGWFIALAVMGLLGAIVGPFWLVERRRARVRMQRLERARALDQERARIAQDLHDDLGARLTQIQLLGQLDADRGDDRERRLHNALQQITAVACEMVQTLDNIVWALNPQHDNLLQLADYLARFVAEFFRQTPICCRLDVPVELPHRPLSTKQCHHLLMTVKEACHNAVRHARATEIWFRMSLTEGALVISIEDNGCGFDAQALPAGGNGLRIQRERLASLGGRIELHSAPGRGTRVKLVVPLPQEE